MKRAAWLLLAAALAACSAPPSGAPAAEAVGSEAPMGMRSGMHQRHSASVPTEYSGLSDPAPADQQSLARGAAIYATHCATCHGDGGMGDGPAGAALDPSPAPIAHTSQMMSDAYLFWRISEGGVPFGTAMPVWKGTLDEGARWDVINYVRALGRGEATPAASVGGAAFDPEVEIARRAEMLARAVESGILSKTEADLFDEVHTALDRHIDRLSGLSGDTAAERQTAMLSALVDDGILTRAQADAFADIHNRLTAAGLME